MGGEIVHGFQQDPWVWYIYPHFPDEPNVGLRCLTARSSDTTKLNLGKYTIPMDLMGLIAAIKRESKTTRKKPHGSIFSITETHGVNSICPMTDPWDVCDIYLRF